MIQQGTLLKCILRRSLSKSWRNVNLTRPYHGSLVLSSQMYNRDLKPGPYPRTAEERAAAARKYNLRVEDYEPYPEEDGMGHGDYPKLPAIGGEYRDPYEDWDDPFDKRNFGEPLHVFHDCYSESQYNPNRYDMYPWTRWNSLFFFLSFCGLFIGAVWAFSPVIHGPKMMPKQFPYSYGQPQIRRLSHYSFDAPDEASHH